LALLISTAWVTKYTALILSKCLDTQPGRLFDFADIGEAAFGPSARSIVSVLFISELYFTCVAFIILISDSLKALYPSIDLVTFRVVAFVICTLSTFVKQLKYISYASLIGIFACCNLIVVVLVDGFTKSDKPGSLTDVEYTTYWPEKWGAVSLSFGIVMAGFAGHAGMCHFVKLWLHYLLTLLNHPL
jgi:vesicular inhibitory amino acid transporter